MGRRLREPDLTVEDEGHLTRFLTKGPRAQGYVPTVVEDGESAVRLLEHVWGYDYDPGTKVVEVYIGYLRRKLGGKAIETVRGMGYVVR